MKAVKNEEYFVVRFSLIPDSQMNINSYLHPKSKELIFKEWLDSFTSNKECTHKNHNYALYCSKISETRYVITFAKQKKTSVGKKTIRGIEDVDIDDYRKCTILIDLSHQFMMISKNTDISTKVEVQKDLINTLINKFLVEFSLYIELIIYSEKNDFWKYVTEHQKEITELELQLASPNLLRGIHTVSDFLHELNGKYNNTSTTIKLSNPSGNLQIPQDEFLEDAIRYTFSGCGNWKLKTISGKPITNADNLKIEKLPSNLSNLSTESKEIINYVFDRLNETDPAIKEGIQHESKT